MFNNKEYGCHLLAQPNGSNVHATSLKYLCITYLIKTKRTKTIILRKVSLNFSGITTEVDKDEDKASLPDTEVGEVEDFSQQQLADFEAENEDEDEDEPESKKPKY